MMDQKLATYNTYVTSNDEKNGFQISGVGSYLGLPKASMVESYQLTEMVFLGLSMAYESITYKVESIEWFVSYFC